jgi:hypothetical protein
MRQVANKYLLLLFLVLLFQTKVFSQNYVSYVANYYGSASATVNGNSDVLTCDVPNGTTLTECTISIYHPDEYSQNVTNSQVFNSMNLYISSSNFESTIKNDIEMNEYTEFELISNQTSYFFVQQQYNCNTEADLSMGFSSFHPFPTNLSNEYTIATTNINSNDPEIESKAISLTNGCATMQEAVRKIAIWVSGYAISSEFDMPIFQSTFKWGTMNGPHAVYEVYYPDAGWCIADPQRTINFNTTHFIKHRTGADNCDKLKEITCNYTGAEPYVYIPESCGAVTSFNNNYQYNDYIPFYAPYENRTLLSVGSAQSTGINDEVEITSTTEQFKSGETVSFNASFSSGSGNTYPVNWDWSLILYYTNGTYILEHENSSYSFWQTTTPPLLPSNSWLYDSSNNIFGEVVVTVDVNDGDFISTSLPVSVEECDGLYILDEVYTTNTQQEACYITLDNIDVQNNSSLIVNSEMGVTIEKDFHMEAGTQLDVY